MSNARRSVDLILNNLQVFEARIALLENEIREKEAQLAAQAGKLKAEVEKNGRLNVEVAELNRMIKQSEESHRIALAEAAKYSELKQKTAADLEGEKARLMSRLEEALQRAQSIDHELQGTHKALEAKELELQQVKKNYIPVEKYRRVLEEREIALEKVNELETNLLTQTTHNESLRDRLNTVKQEFKSTLSDNDERHKKEINDIHNQMTRKFDTNNTVAGQRGVGKDGVRAKSQTLADLDVSHKRGSFKGIDSENLRISWDQIDLIESGVREEGRESRPIERGNLSAQYEELKNQFELFKSENKKELAATNARIRSLLEENGRLKAEVHKVNTEKLTLKKSLNDAQSRENSFIRKSSTPTVGNDIMEKVGRLEKQLLAAKKESKQLKQKLTEDALKAQWQADLLFTACVSALSSQK